MVQSRWQELLYDHDGVVLFGLNGWIHTMDAGTGDTLWSYESRGPAELVEDGVVYLSAYGTGGRIDAVEALQVSTGELLWRRELGSGQFFSAASDGILYLEDGDDIEAIDALTGKLLWRHAPVGRYAFFRSAINGVVTVTSQQIPPRSFHPVLTEIDRLCALDATTGQSLWCIENNDSDHPGFGEIHIGEMVYLRSTNGISALSARTRGLLWRYEIDATEEGDTARSRLKEVDGFLLLDTAGMIHALDPATGNLFWRYKPKQELIGSRALADGVVYAETEEGLLAFPAFSSPAPASTQAPTTRQRCQNGIAVPDPGDNPKTVTMIGASLAMRATTMTMAQLLATSKSLGAPFHILTMILSLRPMRSPSEGQSSMKWATLSGWTVVVTGGPCWSCPQHPGPGNR